MLSGLRFNTGIVQSIDNQDRITVKANGGHEIRVINLATTFLGAVEDKVALASIKPGMSVNMWGNDTQVEFASVNYK